MAHRTASVRRLAAVMGAAALVGTACSGGSAGFRPPPTLHAAPEPAASPAQPATPAGRLVPVGHAPEGLAVVGSTLAVAVRGIDPGLDLLDAATGRLDTFVPLPGEARHLEVAGPGGPLLVPIETANRLDEVSLPGGQLIESVAVGTQPHDVAAVGSVVMVGDELADTADLVSGGRVTARVPAPIQPGGLAAVDGHFVVVGVRARLVAVYRPDGTQVGQAAAGAGPTHVVAGAGGYFFVADTLGGSLLVYRLDGDRVRETAHVGLGKGSRPYGLASDPSSGWVYVTLTGDDQVVGLRFADGRVAERRTWATGQQPNSVAVDPGARSLVVADTASDQVEFIPLP